MFAAIKSCNRMRFEFLLDEFEKQIHNLMKPIIQLFG